MPTLPWVQLWTLILMSGLDWLSEALIHLQASVLQRLAADQRANQQSFQQGSDADAEMRTMEPLSVASLPHGFKQIP